MADDGGLDIGSRVYLDLKPGTITGTSPDAPGWWVITFDDGTRTAPDCGHPSLFPAERLAEAVAHELYWQLERMRSDTNGGAGPDPAPYGGATALMASSMRTYALLVEQEKERARHAAQRLGAIKTQLGDRQPFRERSR